MFEAQYNEEMAIEVQRIEAQNRAINAGHPEWLNACASCQCELQVSDETLCNLCK